MGFSGLEIAGQHNRKHGAEVVDVGQGRKGGSQVRMGVINRKGRGFKDPELT